MPSEITTVIALRNPEAPRFPLPSAHLDEGFGRPFWQIIHEIILTDTFAPGEPDDLQKVVSTRLIPQNSDTILVDGLGLLVANLGFGDVYNLGPILKRVTKGQLIDLTIDYETTVDTAEKRSAVNQHISSLLDGFLVNIWANTGSTVLGQLNQLDALGIKYQLVSAMEI